MKFHYTICYREMSLRAINIAKWTLEASGILQETNRRLN